MKEFKRIPANKNSIANRKKVFGVGINDSDYLTQPKINGKQVICPVYRLWKNMIGRAYNPSVHLDSPTYSEVTVDDEWFVFSSFSKWFCLNYIDGFELDKDIKIKGNKAYSPEACLFVPQSINKLLNDHASKRGDLPVGVSLDKASGRYMAHVRVDGSLRHEGSFECKHDASEAYKLAKNKEILRKCKQYPELAKYLKQHMFELSQEKQRQLDMIKGMLK